MKNGIAKAKLTGEQTVFTSLLRGEVDMLTYPFNDISVQLMPLGKPKISMDLSDERMRVGISMKLAAMGTPETPDSEKLRERLRADLLETVAVCQRYGIEPFGFAEKAAREFFTIESWQEYGWAERFKQSKVDIELDIRPVQY